MDFNKLATHLSGIQPILENEADLTESSALWSENKSLISLAQYGFNSCWKKAQEKTILT